MANQLHGYNPSSYGGGAAGLYSSRSIADSYLSGESSFLGSSRYMGADPSSYSDRGSSMLFSQSDALRFSAADIGSRSYGGGIGVSQASWPGLDIGSAADPLGAGFKRPSECKCLLLGFLYIPSLHDCSFILASPCGFLPIWLFQPLVLSWRSKESKKSKVKGKYSNFSVMFDSYNAQLQLVFIHLKRPSALLGWSLVFLIQIASE